jgi:hypothetical protein
MPKLNSYVPAGAPLQQLNFTVPAGTFGTFPATGPIPATASSITSPVQFGALIYATATQPLTQLYKVKLGVQQTRLGTDQARRAN